LLKKALGLSSKIQKVKVAGSRSTFKTPASLDTDTSMCRIYKTPKVRNTHRDKCREEPEAGDLPSVTNFLFIFLKSSKNTKNLNSLLSDC